MSPLFILIQFHPFSILSSSFFFFPHFQLKFLWISFDTFFLCNEWPNQPPKRYSTVVRSNTCIRTNIFSRSFRFWKDMHSSHAKRNSVPSIQDRVENVCRRNSAQGHNVANVLRQLGKRKRKVSRNLNRGQQEQHQLLRYSLNRSLSFSRLLRNHGLCKDMYFAFKFFRLMLDPESWNMLDLGTACVLRFGIEFGSDDTCV